MLIYYADACRADAIIYYCFIIIDFRFTLSPLRHYAFSFAFCFDIMRLSASITSPSRLQRFRHLVTLFWPGDNTLPLYAAFVY